MAGCHTRWVRPEPQIEDPERIMIREALAFGKALYDRRTALGLSVAELVHRGGRYRADGRPAPAVRRRAERRCPPHFGARSGFRVVRAARGLIVAPFAGVEIGVRGGGFGGYRAVHVEP